MPQTAPDYEAMADLSLAHHAGRGDREAFRTIMQRCNQRLFRVARAVVGSDDEAEDVLQETYLRAYVALHSFRGDCALSTWLTTITLNEARGRLRKRKVLEELTAMDEETRSRIIPLHSHASVADPEAEAARTEVRRLLESAVDALTPDFRLVFMLREVEGLSVEETSAQLGLSAGTVKSRLHRAHAALRRELDRKLTAGLSSAFPFLGRRCARITQRVIARLDGMLTASPSI